MYCIRFAKLVAFSITTCLAFAGTPCLSQDVDSLSINLKQGISIEFVYIQPGEFTMGRNIDAIETFMRAVNMTAKATNEGPAHRVKISRGYFLAKYKVTAAQYCCFLNSIVGEKRTSLIVVNERSTIFLDADGQYKPRPGCNDCPANTVSWNGAQEFCEWFSTESRWTVRLPTEAEWEFAARGVEGRMYPWVGGIRGPIDLGDSTTSVFDNPRGGTPDGVMGLLHAVGDWVSDYYSDYTGEFQIDPTGPVAELEKNGRGYGHVLRRCLSVLTERGPEGDIGNNGIYGFRPVLALEKPAIGVEPTK